jgi:hypothetical protein
VVKSAGKIRSNFKQTSARKAASCGEFRTAAHLDGKPQRLRCRKESNQDNIYCTSVHCSSSARKTKAETYWRRQKSKEAYSIHHRRQQPPNSGFKPDVSKLKFFASLQDDNGRATTERQQPVVPFSKARRSHLIAVTSQGDLNQLQRKLKGLLKGNDESPYTRKGARFITE